MSGDLNNIVQGPSGTINVESIDFDGQDAVTIDAINGGVSIDGTGDSNLTVTGSNKDLDIAVAGGSTQELRLASAGTGASAIHLNASGGGINIDSADMIDIDAADEITIDTTSAAGHIAITSAHTAGQSILISANANAGSILDIDAGILNADIQGNIDIESTSGSIKLGENLTDGQKLILGPNGATEMIFTPHGTPASEKISLTNTAGTANDAIKLLSTAGGVTIDGGNGTIQFADNGASLGTITSSGYSGKAAGLSGVTATAAELNVLDESAVPTVTGLLGAQPLADGVLTYDATANTIKWHTLASVCFLKGTKITLADKTQKNIEDLCVGETILTYQIKGLSNLKKDQKHEIMDWSQDSMEGIFRQNKVKNTWVNPTDRYIVINDKLRVTNLHIIHVKRDNEYKFLPAENVQLGDKLFTDKGKYESITEIKQVNERTEVYNIEVKKNKTYFAENYLVHHFCETCSGLSGRI